MKWYVTISMSIVASVLAYILIRYIENEYFAKREAAKIHITTGGPKVDPQILDPTVDMGKR